LSEFAESTSRALGQQIIYDLRASVNPLVYTLRVKWQDPVNGKVKNDIWNLFQIWAHKNDAVPEGKVEAGDTALFISIGTKRRLGPDKNEKP
jgi:hypothetical protein